MAHDAVAARYAEALLITAKAQNQVEPLRKQLNLLRKLLSEQPTLGQFLNDPGVLPDQKIALLKKALGKGTSEWIEAFLRMVVAFGRADLLAVIAEAFDEAVDVDQGLVRAVVRSVHPLTQTALTRLHQRLESIEKKTVILTSEQDPELLGGLQVILGHRVIDYSISRQLQELSQQLTTLRVH